MALWSGCRERRGEWIYREIREDTVCVDRWGGGGEIKTLNIYRYREEKAETIDRKGNIQVHTWQALGA